MKRELETWQLVERSAQKKYRRALWTPFMLAVKRYALIRPGDRIAVGVSGGRASLLLALLMRQLQRFSEAPFEAVFLAADPVGDAAKREALSRLAETLRLPLEFVPVDPDRRERIGADDPREDPDVPADAVADVVPPSDPAWLKALRARAEALGCTALALGDCMDDAARAVLADMLYEGRLRGLPPKARAGKLALIRPLYCVRDDDIRAWARYNGLPDASLTPPDATRLRRDAAGSLLAQLRRDNPDVDSSVFNSVHAVCLETFPGWTFRGRAHGFLEAYESGYREQGTGSREQE